MNYPLISEYIESIRSAEENFDKLNNLRPMLDSSGNPIMSSGNFAVVFKMKDTDTGKLYAVKCFTREQEHRNKHYQKIAEELEFVSSPYLVHFRFLDKELFVDTTQSNETEFPVLMMDWVEGQPMDVYIKEYLHDRYALQMLAYRFCRMGAWLLSQPFAHGDLKPDNILVRKDGTLVLVDYDGMYVPALEGESANELGSPDFRHPLRTEKDFNEHIDDLSIASIALSLKAISLNTELYSQYASSDRLLFSAANYRDIGNSAALQTIIKMVSDTELSALVSAFLLTLSKNNLSMMSFRIFLLREPERPKIEILSTEITDEERANAITDEFGVKYTADGLKLIEAPKSLTSYTIKEGTMVIGIWAFSLCKSLQSIYIPNSVTSIGNTAFSWCESLQSVHISDSVISIKDGVFIGCKSLQSIHIPNSVTSIGNNAFEGCHSLQSIYIPDSVTSIGYGTFSYCKSLQSIHIPDSVTKIEDFAFNGCYSLQSICISKGTRDKILKLLGNQYKDKLIEK